MLLRIGMRGDTSPLILSCENICQCCFKYAQRRFGLHKDLAPMLFELRDNGCLFQIDYGWGGGVVWMLAQSCVCVSWVSYGEFWAGVFARHLQQGGTTVVDSPGVSLDDLGCP
jgi:hypothetical protein